MKVAPAIGHDPAPGWSVRITPNPGVPSQLALAAAAQIGLAGLIGAFLAGIVLSVSAEPLQLDEQTRPLIESRISFGG